MWTEELLVIMSFIKKKRQVRPMPCIYETKSRIKKVPDSNVIPTMLESKINVIKKVDIVGCELMKLLKH